MRKTPLETRLRIERAMERLRLGYPDLAAGDLYKAKLWLEARIMAFVENPPLNALQEQARRAAIQDIFEIQTKTYEMLVIVLKMSNDRKSLLVLRKKAKSYPPRDIFTVIHNDAVGFFEQRSQELKSAPISAGVVEMNHECGCMKYLSYPFLPSKYLNRSSNLMESTKRLWNSASESQSYHAVMS